MATLSKEICSCLCVSGIVPQFAAGKARWNPVRSIRMRPMLWLAVFPVSDNLESKCPEWVLRRAYYWMAGSFYEIGTRKKDEKKTQSPLNRAVAYAMLWGVISLFNDQSVIFVSFLLSLNPQIRLDGGENGKVIANGPDGSGWAMSLWALSRFINLNELWMRLNW